MDVICLMLKTVSSFVATQLLDTILRPAYTDTGLEEN